MRILAAALLVGLGTAGIGWAGGQNQGPPVGAILDLNGTPVPGGGDGTTFQHYTVNFTAAVANTTITFAFRDDPAELLVENFSVADLTAPATNLLINGNLSGGTYTSNGNSGTPVGWLYANIYGATDGASRDAHFSSSPNLRKPRTGRSAGPAESSPAVAETRRAPGDHQLPLAGGPHRQRCAPRRSEARSLPVAHEEAGDGY